MKTCSEQSSYRDFYTLLLRLEPFWQIYNFELKIVKAKNACFGSFWEASKSFEKLPKHAFLEERFFSRNPKFVKMTLNVKVVHMSIVNLVVLNKFLL